MSISEDALATTAATLAGSILAAGQFTKPGERAAPEAVKVFGAVLEELRKHYVRSTTVESIQRSRAILDANG